MPRERTRAEWLRFVEEQLRYDPALALDRERRAQLRAMLTEARRDEPARPRTDRERRAELARLRAKGEQVVVRRGGGVEVAPPPRSGKTVVLHAVFIAIEAPAPQDNTAAARDGPASRLYVLVARGRRRRIRRRPARKRCSCLPLVAPKGLGRSYFASRTGWNFTGWT